MLKAKGVDTAEVTAEMKKLGDTIAKNDQTLTGSRRR